MWIRSQDKKTLVYCTRLAVVGRTIQNLPATGIEDDYDVMGKYESEERAIEVLDNIQSQLRSTVEVVREVESDKYKQCFVFQMPEE
jgi:hypothetical protein